MASMESNRRIKGTRIIGDHRTRLAEELRERYAGGDSIRAIADEVGRSYGFVQRLLKESGADLRGRGGDTRSRHVRPGMGTTIEEH